MGSTRLIQRGQSGFTLIELLIGLAILGAVTVAVGAVSINGTLQVADQNVERHLDSTTAQFVSLAFGRDVQGAQGIGPASCGSGIHGVALVTLEASDDGSAVTYRDRTVGDSHELVRAECDPAGALVSVDTVVDGLSASPAVTCSPTSCTPGGAPPRAVTLVVTRTDRFAFAVDGVRRTGDDPVIPPVLPAQLFALGGSTPLTVGGNANLTVTGNAFVNSTATAAVSVSGNNARLRVTDQFKILTGGGCSGCNAVKVAPFPPGSFPAALPDPLGYLPAPSGSGMSAGACSAGVCRPGIYAERLTLTGSATLQPGVYVLRKGLAVSGNGTVNAQGVFLFNGCERDAPPGCSGNQGSFSISGQAAVNMSPLTSGTYSGILLYQARSNANTVSISGGSALMLFAGVMYAPGSTQVALGAGGGGLRLGAVIGRNLLVTGNGTVQVNGA